LKREIRSLSLKNSCHLEIKDGQNFTHPLPHLHTVSFDPYCPNCLQIDENINQNRHVQGGCLENFFKSVDISQMTNEIAACLAYLILLVVLYIIKFVKQEIVNFFTHRN